MLPIICSIVLLLDPNTTMPPTTAAIPQIKTAGFNLIGASAMANIRSPPTKIQTFENRMVFRHLSADAASSSILISNCSI